MHLCQMCDITRGNLSNYMQLPSGAAKDLYNIFPTYVVVLTQTFKHTLR